MIFMTTFFCFKRQALLNRRTYDILFRIMYWQISRTLLYSIGFFHIGSGAYFNRCIVVITYSLALSGIMAHQQKIGPRHFHKSKGICYWTDCCTIDLVILIYILKKSVHMYTLTIYRNSIFRGQCLFILNEDKYQYTLA